MVRLSKRCCNDVRQVLSDIVINKDNFVLYTKPFLLNDFIDFMKLGHIQIFLKAFSVYNTIRFLSNANHAFSRMENWLNS